MASRKGPRIARAIDVGFTAIVAVSSVLLARIAFMKSYVANVETSRVLVLLLSDVKDKPTSIPAARNAKSAAQAARAESLWKLGDSVGAVALLNAALAAAPEASLFWQLGYYLRCSHNYGGAAAVAESAYRRDPRLIATRILRGIALAESAAALLVASDTTAGLRLYGKFRGHNKRL